MITKKVFVHPRMVHFEHDSQIRAKSASPRIEFSIPHAVGLQARGQGTIHRVFPELGDFTIRERVLQVEPSCIDCGYGVPPVR
jgi:hypothetical protein